MSENEKHIEATLRLDIDGTEATFDASPWLEKATLEEIIQADEDGWNESYVTDRIGLESKDETVIDLFGDLEVLNRYNVEKSGYSVNLDPDSVREWLAKHRPEIFAKLPVRD